ncbi:hypothetical protein QNI19_33895 [Cytophagaceae bacterium DM2B3-1]|uniref:Lipoprotein n=1 Tax=Xanthocytophaga flava TaxID=3048013 RepID=A0ABT7CW37_9BACT|nr:hypothetical protein [Xanthocytophaga flavus]MDJ1472634.1 hypothetical protein [Xanthocytophaga flavus]MDJ1497984.1 hypothetical protein [Xanthocytophaga flavus]
MKRILLIILILSGACSSGKKALQKGNYEEAIMKAINRLRSSPNNSKARETLRDGYPLTLEYHTNRISNLRNSNEAFKYEGIIASYQALTQLTNEIQRCPACREEVPNARTYLNEIGEAKQLAATERYNAGVVAFDRDNTRESAKEAYLHFLRASEFVPNYKDVQQRMQQAKFEATLKVVFEQIPVHSRAYSLSNEFFQNKINQFVGSEKMNEFVRFYTPGEAQKVGLRNPDHLVRMQFDDFVVGQVYMKESTEEISRDSVIVGQVKTAAGNKNVYGTVKAKFTLFQKTISSRGLMDLQVMDPQTKRVLFQEKMPGEFVWRSEWASYKGDERALTDKQVKLSQLREAQPPAPQDLFIEFCKPIYTQATGTLRKYYQNY